MGPDPHEPIHDIAHLGSVELLTPKFDRRLWYFRDVLGMEVVHSAGDYASTALKLTAADHAGLGAGWNEGEFGRGRSYRFRDPEGHVMEVYYDESRNRAPDSFIEYATPDAALTGAAQKPVPVFAPR